jgi:hypothetical protein
MGGDDCGDDMPLHGGGVLNRTTLGFALPSRSGLLPVSGRYVWWLLEGVCIFCNNSSAQRSLTVREATYFQLYPAQISEAA